MAIAAVNIVVSVALTPAAGVITQELAGGGAISGDVLGQVVDAAVEGLQSLADPIKLVKKAISKAITKGKDLPGANI